MSRIKVAKYIMDRLEPGVNLNPKLRDWILPHWYQRQNNLFGPAYVVNGNKFYNSACRSWTAFRAGNSQWKVLCDRCGVIYLEKIRISIEIWVHTGEFFYTPGSYQRIVQNFTPQNRGLETICSYKTGACRISLDPEVNPAKEEVGLEISLQNRAEEALKQSAVYLVVRPFDYNGQSNIKRLKYAAPYLLINDLPVLFMEKDPDHLYFSNEEFGDITRYFQLGEGNDGIGSTEGLATCLLGYSGLPAELSGIKLSICGEPRRIFVNLLPWGRKLCKARFIKSSKEFKDWKRIITGTRIDRLLEANLYYLQVFSGPAFNSVDIFQIYTLNRFTGGRLSLYYLKECLRRVGWDGSLNYDFLGPEKLILAVSDYFKLTGDGELLDYAWPVLKKAADGLWYQKVKNFSAGKFIPRDKFNNGEGFFEHYFWLGAALKTMAGLAETHGLFAEIQLYEERYLRFWAELMGLLSNTAKGAGPKIIPFHFYNKYTGNLVRSLTASYPLQLWEKGNRYIIDTIQFLYKDHYCQGGIYSPADFYGIDLELTARFGQILLREGYDYSQVLKLLLAAAGQSWSWPDKINPLTMEGVGENGHDPGAMYQILLLIRNILALEEGEFLYLLPGVLRCKLWERAQLKIDRLATFFGEFSLKYATLGQVIQIEYYPSYRIKPQKIRFWLAQFQQPVFADSEYVMKGRMLEIGPDFHILRLKRLRSSGLS